ncbi:hypothetical protein [Saccharopolyspora shandongensis]|uniref:hypothetical protein n=1 Tax=Saccharopolyspora shandongensis TaxID=418495 RepID=UPI0033D6A9E2
MAALLVVVAALGWTVTCPPRRAQHAGAGPGALMVWQLVERIESETRSGGRHRLRTLTMHGDLIDGDELATTETRMLPLIESGLPVGDRKAMQRHRGMVRRLLAALHGLAS